MGGRFGEIILILILLLLFFGPNKLPDMGRSIGKALNEFKKAVNGDTQPTQPQPPAQSAVEPSSPKKSRKTAARKRKSKLIS